ncbi:MAG: DUF4910 domain-containing protein [Kosmotogaceae bacterium]
MKLVNGDQVKSLVRLISGYNRAVGTKEYHKITEKLADYLSKNGIPSNLITFKKYKSDGLVRYGNLKTHKIWTREESTLWLNKPFKRFLVSTREKPLSLVFGSVSTEGRKSYSLVEYHGSGDYKGKVILTDKHPSNIFEEVIEKGQAKGIITCHMRMESEDIGRTPKQLSSLTNYLRLPYHDSAVSSRAFAFSVTYEIFDFLKKIMKNNEVEIKAEVNSKLENGNVEVLEIDLTKDQKSRYGIITAHLCHPSPGANDNASGAALATELCKELINEEYLPVKVILVPEFFGSMPYAMELNKNEELPLFTINLDMVGEDQESTKGTLLLTEAPPVLPQKETELLYYYLNEGLPSYGFFPMKRFYRVPFMGGSDHCVFSAYGIPSPFIGHLPDKYYHSDFDSVENVDPAELEWVGNAVLKSLSVSKRKEEANIFTSSQLFGSFMYYKQKLAGKPGSYELMQRMIKTFEIENSDISDLVKLEGLISSQTPLLPRFEGTIGFDWQKDIPKDLKVYEEKLGNWAEFINIVSNVVGSRESAETLTSIYYKQPEEIIARLVDYLVDAGYFQT